MVTGERTGWTFDSSMRSSETDEHSLLTEFSEIISPAFSVEMYSSMFWDDDDDVDDILLHYLSC